jgi:energy-coupling factor transporter transmembrane protein EcfT
MFGYLSTREATDLFHISPEFLDWICVVPFLILIYIVVITILCARAGGGWAFFAFFQLLAVTGLGLYINATWFLFPIDPSGKWQGYQRSNTAHFDGATTTLQLDGGNNSQTFKAVTTLEDNSQIIQSGRWETGTGYNTVSLIDGSHRIFTFKRRGHFLINESTSPLFLRNKRTSRNGVNTNI